MRFTSVHCWRDGRKPIKLHLLYATITIQALLNLYATVTNQLEFQLGIIITKQLLTAPPQSVKQVLRGTVNNYEIAFVLLCISG